MKNNIHNSEYKSIRYFGGFSGYKLPLTPDNEISKEEALNRLSYCIAYYDKDRLIKFEKYFDNKLFFRFEYEYYDNGKIRRSRGANKDGQENILMFDKNGKLIEEKK